MSTQFHESCMLVHANSCCCCRSTHHRCTTFSMTNHVIFSMKTINESSNLLYVDILEMTVTKIVYQIYVQKPMIITSPGRHFLHASHATETSLARNSHHPHHPRQIAAAIIAYHRAQVKQRIAKLPAKNNIENLLKPSHLTSNILMSFNIQKPCSSGLTLQQSEAREKVYILAVANVDLAF